MLFSVMTKYTFYKGKMNKSCGEGSVSKPRNQNLRCIKEKYSKLGVRKKKLELCNSIMSIIVHHTRYIGRIQVYVDICVHLG